MESKREAGKNDRQNDRAIEIPAQVLTPDEQTVDVSGDVWTMRVRAESAASLSIRVGHLKNQLSQRVSRQILLYLTERLRTVKPHTVKNDAEAFWRFVKWWKKEASGDLSWEKVTEIKLRNFLNYGLTTGNRGNDFARLRKFYRWGAFTRQFPDFEPKIAKAIGSVRASGNRKGEAVRTLDPSKGPFDDTEVKIIRDALADEVGNVEQRITVQFFLELGVRAMVLPILRGKHFRREELEIVTPGGNPGIKRFYQVQIPKVKRRAAKINDWNWRPVSDQLGREIERFGATDEDLLLPWLSHVDLNDLDWADHRGSYDAHYARITSDLRDWASEANLFSPRTGRPLHLTPRRFRYTLATNAAIEGASRAEIATLLDHSDLQNVDVYVDASSVVLNRMQEDGAFDFFDDVVDLFRGEIADTDTTDLPSEHIPGSAPHLDGLSNVTGTVGACRKDSPCSLAPPLSCYTCPLFTAFRDAPHDRVASALREEIHSVKKSVDRRIPQQLIATYQAVEQLRKRLDEGR